jgi:ABC-type oligopeptide transport system ATPase subunit
MAGQIVFKGNVVSAKYRSDEVAMYKHNPYIEALPPILNMKEVAMRISRKPSYNEEDRNFPPLQRIHLVQTIANFVKTLPMHIDLESRFSRMIRNGYMARNPIKAEWVKQVRSGFPEIIWGSGDDDYEPLIRSTASGFAIIGPSGVGKTTAIESVLGLYPQVINHTEYNGHPFDRKQLVWLKLDCPQDGSIKGLCLNFFQSIDKVLESKYYDKFKKSKSTVDVLIPEMANLSFNLGLGVIVIDEIQRLSEANSGGAKRMLNAFVQIVNTIGVPVVTVGTYKAFKLLKSEFATARRSSGQGDLVWSNFIKDDIWNSFIDKLWEYQWTNEKTPLTPSLSKALYEESLGIIDIAVKLYMLVQWRVISLEDEKITVGLIREIAKDSLKLVRPILEALRQNDIGLLETISDIEPSVIDMRDYLNTAAERVALVGTVNTIGNQDALNKDVDAEEESPFLRIAQWLVDAGIETGIARECAEKSVAIYESDYDLKKAMFFAYEQAIHVSLDIEEKKLEEEEPRKKKKVKKKTSMESEKIKEIIQEDSTNIDDVLADGK